MPTPFQFYLTDVDANFLRAALYFNTATRNDSLWNYGVLSIIIDYLKEDMIHIINTLKWK